MRIIPCMDARAKTLVGAVAAIAVVGLVSFRSTMPDLESTLRGQATPTPRTSKPSLQLARGPPVYIPPSLNTAQRRQLSLNLGGGACKWQPAEYDVPEDITFYKTLIAGFPSCDKRMTFTQMEALTGWPARDEWDFVFYGETNHPFIKSNYPHHEGYWSWNTLADQVVLVVRNMRKTMVEYHDILWDIASAKKSNLSYLDALYRYRPPIDSFFEWRDLRVLDEVHWYGWFIDYWMEGGLRRDIFEHKITDEEHWPYAPPVDPTPACVSDPWHRHTTSPNTCSNTGVYTPPTPPPTRTPTPFPTHAPTTSAPTPNATDVNYTAPVLPTHPPTPPPVPIAVTPEEYLFSSAAACCAYSFPGQQCFLQDVCPTPAPTPAIPETYDPHCANGEITNGCEPVAVISAEKLRDLTEGAAETTAIANVLSDKPGIGEYLIAPEAWDCIWEELIPNGKGMRMVSDRAGYVEEDYNFSAEMLQEMISEYDRLITKYSDSYWSAKPTAVRLVQLLMDSRGLIQMELNDVQSGARTLTERDFLGPVERDRRRRLRAVEEGRNPDKETTNVKEKRKHFEYFMALEEKVKTTQRAEKARKRQEERRAAAREKRKLERQAER
ncbi:hypothetical protein ACHAXT_003853 [Thalassiosira profunda]